MAAAPKDLETPAAAAAATPAAAVAAVAAAVAAAAEPSLCSFLPAKACLDRATAWTVLQVNGWEMGQG